MGLSEQLHESSRMHASGSLTDAEFADAKRRLLAGGHSDTTSASAPLPPARSPRAPLSPRSSLVDLVVVVMLTFAVHRGVHGVLSAPLSLWLYYPTLWVATAGYLLVRRRPFPSELSPGLLTARSATAAVAAAVGMLIGLWVVGSGILYLAHRAGEAPFPDMPWWVPIRPGAGVVLPVVILAVTIGALRGGVRLPWRGVCGAPRADSPGLGGRSLIRCLCCNTRADQADVPLPRRVADGRGLPAHTKPVRGSARTHHHQRRDPCRCGTSPPLRSARRPCVEPRRAWPRKRKDWQLTLLGLHHHKPGDGCRTIDPSGRLRGLAHPLAVRGCVRRGAVLGPLFRVRAEHASMLPRSSRPHDPCGPVRVMGTRAGLDKSRSEPGRCAWSLSGRRCGRVLTP